MKYSKPNSMGDVTSRKERMKNLNPSKAQKVGKSISKALDKFKKK